MMPVADRKVIIIGGSSDHPGGIEAFCDRSTVALGRRGGWVIERQAADTAYLRVGGLARLSRSLLHLIKLRRERPDYLWLQYGNMPDLAYLVVARMLGFRVMVTPHLGSNWRSQSSPFLRRVSGSALRLAHRLALISRTQEQEINLPPAVPRSLIRNFLPEEILGLDLDERASFSGTMQIIHSGRLSEGKGSFMVIEVCAGLRDRGIPFHARITGTADPETHARLVSLIAQHDLGDKVELLGRVPEEELLGHLRESDVLLHLSRIDSYPLIVLEAMACSVLPVCMELAGVRDQVDTYGGHVVSVAQPVAEAVEWLAQQDLDDLRRRARAASARVREDYSWNRCSGALEAALLACTDRGEKEALVSPDGVV